MDNHTQCPRCLGRRHEPFSCDGQGLSHPYATADRLERMAARILNQPFEPRDLLEIMADPPVEADGFVTVTGLTPRPRPSPRPGLDAIAGTDDIQHALRTAREKDDKACSG